MEQAVRTLIHYPQSMDNDASFLAGPNGCLRRFILLLVRIRARHFGLEACAQHLRSSDDWKAIARLFGMQDVVRVARLHHWIRDRAG